MASLGIEGNGGKDHFLLAVEGRIRDGVFMRGFKIYNGRGGGNVFIKRDRREVTSILCNLYDFI